MAGAFIWINLEFFSPKDALRQIWLKLAQWFWRRRFLNFVNVFSFFRNYFPKLPHHPRMLCFKFGEIGPVVLEKMKLWKVYDNDYDISGDNDDEQRTHFD